MRCGGVKTYLVVLGCLIQHLDVHADIDDISIVSGHDTVTWDSVVGQITESDGGGFRVVVTVGISVSIGEDWFLASQDIWPCEIEFHIILHLGLDIS
jgi:hypothetical protein